MPQTELAAALYGPLGFSLGICEGCRGINEPLQQVGKFQARGRVYLVLLHEAFSPLHAFVLPEAEVGLEKLPLGEMKANLELELILDQKGDWECR